MNDNRFLMNMFTFFPWDLQNCEEHKKNVCPEAPGFGPTLENKQYRIFLGVRSDSPAGIHWEVHFLRASLGAGLSMYTQRGFVTKNTWLYIQGLSLCGGQN